MDNKIEANPDKAWPADWRCLGEAHIKSKQKFELCRVLREKERQTEKTRRMRHVVKLAERALALKYSHDHRVCAVKQK